MKKNHSTVSRSLTTYGLQFLAGTLLFVLMFVFQPDAKAQTIVFEDDFNRNESPLGPTGGNPLMTWTVVTSAQGYAKTELIGGSNYRLAIFNGATSTAAASTTGRTYIHGPLSTFSSPFLPVLANNTGDITWTFNIRTGRPDGAGFDATANAYGYATVLCATSSDFLTASGYVVTLRKGTSYNAVRLEKFANGLVANENLTTIVGPSTELPGALNHYFSVKVVYTPTTNTWKFYSRYDGTSPVDPNGGVDPLTLVGTAIDSQYTSTPMTSTGFFLNHQSTSWNSGNNKANFDNFRVVRDVFTHTGDLEKEKPFVLNEDKLIVFKACDIYASTGAKIAAVTENEVHTGIRIEKGMYMIKTSDSVYKVIKP
ncbi:MAG: hypothetical protein RBT57_05235 [Paludibacter sp.]|jgi:hypothetical protein|nr:hypothetical protein [Paludibacter sp.]